MGPGQGSGIRIVLLNYEHSVYNILYTVHCKELTTLYGILVNDIIMLRSWIHDTTEYLNHRYWKIKKYTPRIGIYKGMIPKVAPSSLLP